MGANLVRGHLVAAVVSHCLQGGCGVLWLIVELERVAHWLLRCGWRHGLRGARRRVLDRRSRWLLARAQK